MERVPVTLKSGEFTLVRESVVSVVVRKARRLFPDSHYFAAWLMCMLALIGTTVYLQLVTFPEMQALREAVAAARLLPSDPSQPVELRCVDSASLVAHTEVHR